MLSTASYLSFKANVESLLPWLSVKKATTKAPSADRRSKDIFSVMVTPDRIPKFFIPSLDVHIHRDEGQEAGGGSPPAHLLLGARGEGSRKHSSERSYSEPSVRRGRLGQRQSRRESSSAEGGRLWGGLEGVSDHSDPPTRAAMSLPHLQKITTPYGFLALGEIPHIKRKESLFFEDEVADIRAVPRSGKKSTVLGRSRSTPLSAELQQHQPPGPSPVSRANRAASWESFSQPSPPTYPLPAPSSFTNWRKDKSKFQLLIKKHLKSIKRGRSNSSSER
ncbi:C2 calcium-dependent domain-containing protein 4C-like [Scyliorhinus canicula]|uniref:C2 calcium-dependent domain-containing protein 4C-like n=1 Tax=Scyliorhinus canicula TaxID=7830 RepID=UPI0018F285BE|nr:C2 calcium-dependent domain-containing protein 4C-like [Scyliorhinus canicula]